MPNKELCDCKWIWKQGSPLCSSFFPAFSSIVPTNFQHVLNLSPDFRDLQKTNFFYSVHSWPHNGSFLLTTRLFKKMFNWNAALFAVEVQVF